MEDIQERIHSGFEMEVNAPYSLNYLIFVQNIYLNSKNKDKEKPLFPYTDSSMWGVLNEDFKKNFSEVWKEAVNKNFQSRLYDHNGILELDKSLFQKLFENTEKGGGDIRKVLSPF